MFELSTRLSYSHSTEMQRLERNCVRVKSLVLDMLNLRS